MPGFDSFLDETLEAWWDARNGIIEEVENIPADKFDFRPTAEVRSVREMVQHIIEVAMLVTGELARPDTNLQRMPFDELIKHYGGAAYKAKTKKALVVLLRSQMQEAEEKFREAGELSLWQFIERFDGKQGTKMQWLHHGIAQEMYHRGQLATYARLLGLEPALTKRIRGG